MTRPARPGRSVADPLSRVRRYRYLHYGVLLVSTAAILFLYYAYESHMPTPSGHYLSWFWSVFYFEFRNDVIGLLMLFPILYSAITLGWKRATIVVIILIASIFPYIVTFSYKPYSWIASFGCLLIPPTVIISIEMKLMSDARERRAEEEKHREKAEFMRQLISVQEDLRKRIAQELHDGVAQSLLVTASVAHNMLDDGRVADEAVRTELEAIKRHSLEMVSEVRSICQDLRPSVLDHLGLVSSIKWLIDNLCEETGIRVEYESEGTDFESTPDESLALFRIVQEALNNVKKHSQADTVHVSIAAGADGISIQIRDNGRGFQLPQTYGRLAQSGKLGLLGMAERAQYIGALLEIKPAEGMGTTVSISAPRKAPQGSTETGG